MFIMTAIVTFMHAQLHTLYCACWASSQSTSDQPHEVLTHPAGTASMMPGTLCPQPRRYLGLSCCLQKQLGKTYNVFITFALRYIGFAALSQLLPALLSLGSRLTVSGQVLGLRCPLPAQSDLLHLRPCVSHLGQIASERCWWDFEPTLLRARLDRRLLLREMLDTFSDKSFNLLQVGG